MPPAGVDPKTLDPGWVPGHRRTNIGLSVDKFGAGPMLNALIEEILA